MPPAAALGAEQGQVEDLERPEEPDERDADAARRRAPAGVRALARAPLEVPARPEEQERQQPAAGLEPRRDRVAPPVGERALARAGRGRSA